MVEIKEPLFCKHCGKRLVSKADEFDVYTGMMIRSHRQCPDDLCRLIQRRKELGWG